MALTSEYTRTFTSFSGCDIVATFSDVVIGELQAITVSVSREVAPVYVFGHKEPVSFSRGKRGIGGTLVMTVFDREALVEALKSHAEKSVQKIGAKFENQALSIDEWDKLMTQEISSVAQNTSDSSALLDKISDMADPQYADELPPFDITITFQNEYGQSAVMKIYGVQIINEGMGFSMDNITSEKAYTFVARRIEHMRKVMRKVER